MTRKILLTVVGVAACICCGTACKQDPTPVPPVKSSPPPAAQNDNDDLKTARELVDKDKPALTGMNPHGSGNSPPTDPSLPAGHPPIGQTTGNSTASAAPTTDAITYTAPAAWSSQPVTSQMRKAQFLIPKAAGDTEDGQMVVFYFGQGQGGAVEANIARWKGMFTTADGKPVEDAAFKRESQVINGLNVTTLDITGRYTDPMAGRTSAAPQEWRMLAAIVETPQGPWFFKGVGPVATIGAHEQNFKDLFGSMKVK